MTTSNKTAPDVALEQIAHVLADPDWNTETLNRIAEIVVAAGYPLAPHRLVDKPTDPR